MRLQRSVQSMVVAGILLVGAGLSGRGLAWGQAAATRSRLGRGAASAQGGSTTVLVPQTQVVYQTVQSTECVQVPVTQMQTLYRTEYRTETVPVTRMVPETVNETRTYTVCVPQQKVVRQPVMPDRLRAGHDDAAMLPTRPGDEERGADHLSRPDAPPRS